VISRHQAFALAPVKAPETKRLKKAKCDEPLSSYAFNFILRHYILGPAAAAAAAAEDNALDDTSPAALLLVGRCRLTRG